jgi:hypothetical protein
MRDSGLQKEPRVEATKKTIPQLVSRRKQENCQRKPLDLASSLWGNIPID